MRLRLILLAIMVGCWSVVGYVIEWPSQQTVSASDKDIAGVYAGEGGNTEGGKYTCLVEIIKTGDTYHMRWTFPKTEFRPIGVAILKDGRLTVAYMAGHQQAGLGVYEVHGKTMKGKWTLQGSGTLWVENLERQPDGTTVPDPQPSPPEQPQHNPHADGDDGVRIKV